MREASPARKRSRREELGVESRRKIVEAASALMAERGFAGTSIAAVSQRSGLPSGSIYWHFESKEALLAAVVEDGARRWFAVFEQAGLPDDPVERTAAVFASVESSLESQPEFLRLLLLIALERREIDPTSLAAIRRVRDLALGHIRTVLADLLAPLRLRGTARIADDFARLALAVADGVFVAHHLEPGRGDIRRSFALLRQALTALTREMRSAKTRGGRR